MTRYYPKLMDLKYKDKWLNISIPIRIKILKVINITCEKCRFDTSEKNINEYCEGRGLKFDGINCPVCALPIFKQDKILYKLYTDMRKPLLNVESILNYYTPFIFRKYMGKYTDLYAIERNNLETIYKSFKDFKGLKMKKIKEFNKVVKYKFYELTEEQLQDDYDKYQMRRVAKAI